MNNDIFPKATVTGKRQITIPKEICELLNIKTGQQVVFKREGDRIVFDVEEEHQPCFACNGTGEIEGIGCFVCRAQGKLHKEMNRNIFNLIGYMIMTSRRYGVSIAFKQKEIDEIDYPTIELKSDKISIPKLLRIQDEIQKRIIQLYAPKSTVDGKLSCIPSDAILKKIINNLSTESAKEELAKWFRLPEDSYK